MKTLAEVAALADDWRPWKLQLRDEIRTAIKLAAINHPRGWVTANTIRGFMRTTDPGNDMGNVIAAGIAQGALEPLSPSEAGFAYSGNTKHGNGRRLMKWYKVSFTSLKSWEKNDHARYRKAGA